MTREKAIDLLDNLLGMIEDSQDNDYDTAFKMGINALKSVEKYEKAIKDIKARIQIIREEDYECDGCSDMDMVLDIIDDHIGGVSEWQNGI